MIDEEIIDSFLSAGKKLILLDEHSRIPIQGIGWRTHSYSEDEIKSHKGNLGWALGPEDLVVDVDPRNGGDTAFFELQEHLKLTISPTVSSPSGGFHSYFTGDISTLRLRTKLKAYPGIDFLSEGAYCVIAGSKAESKATGSISEYRWSDDLAPGFHQAKLPKKIISLLMEKDSAQAKTIKSEKDVWAALSVINSNCSYDTWLRIGMSLKDWHEEKGFTIWDKWSRTSEKYNPDEMAYKWETFELTGRVTYKTLFYLATEALNENEVAWSDNWAYIDSHGRYVELATGNIYRTESFNIICQHLVPDSQNTTRQTASFWVRSNSLIEVLNSTGYAPHREERVYEWKGQRVYNTFKRNTVPETAEHYSDSGREGIELIKKHIDAICANEPGANAILLDWLAWQIQRTGEKIRWVPVIFGQEGTGKTIISRVLAAALGEANISTVSPVQATSSFNGWATNAAVIVLEELKISGSNRHATVNAIKPLVTDDVIQINDKGVSQFQCENTANYICFSNHVDCIPVTDTDRRWWMISTPKLTLDQGSEYFSRLNFTINNHGSEIRKWLSEHKISEKFTGMHRAPETTHKLNVIETEQNTVDGFAEVSELLMEGSEFYNSKVACTGPLFRDLELSMVHSGLSRWQQGHLMKSLGFVKYARRRVAIGGKRYSAWVRADISQSEIDEVVDDMENSEF